MLERKAACRKTSQASFLFQSVYFTVFYAQWNDGDFYSHFPIDVIYPIVQTGKIFFIGSNISSTLLSFNQAGAIINWGGLTSFHVS